MISLVELERGSKAIITQIKGGKGFKLRLESMNIRIGKKLIKVSSAPFRGPVVIKIDGCELALGRGMAQKVYVEVIDEDTVNG